ncbi:unnamed protein product, partial [Pylaiella littoralis]
ENSAQGDGEPIIPVIADETAVEASPAEGEKVHSSALPSLSTESTRVGRDERGTSRKFGGPESVGVPTTSNTIDENSKVDGKEKDMNQKHENNQGE